MTHEEFDSTKLPIRIDFRTSECARSVLVFKNPLKVALKQCGFDDPIDLATMREVIKMFLEAKR